MALLQALRLNSGECNRHNSCFQGAYSLMGENGENAHALALQVRCSNTKRFHRNSYYHTVVVMGMGFGVRLT